MATAAARKEPKTDVLRVTRREFHTIMAALRFWQVEAIDIDSNTIESPNYQKVASNNGLCEPLDFEEVDALCERINFVGN